MSAEAKQTLFEGMDERRQRALAIVEQAGPDRVVHLDTGWTVKDLVAHLTLWERVSLETLLHANRGEHYFVEGLADGLDAFNNADRERCLSFSMEQVMADWADIREQLKQALADIPDDSWETPIKTIWSREPIPPAQLAKGMGIHEKHHISEIEAALNTA